MPLSLTFLDDFAIETTLIVSPFNLPVTVTWSVRRVRFARSLYNVLDPIRLNKAIRFTSPDILLRMSAVVERWSWIGASQSAQKSLRLYIDEEIGG